MLCNRVLKHLSEYFDEVLNADTAVEVSQHLRQCAGCRKQYESLVSLHSRLKSLEQIQAPEYMGAFVRLRIAQDNEDRWHKRLRNWLELSWSRIRTTEGIWYWTRALGTVLTSICFFLINPLYFDVNQPLSDRATPPAAYTQQVGINVLQKLGMLPAEPSTGHQVRSKPAINYAYLVNFAQNMPRAGKDDTLSVVTVVDSSGTATIKNVLQYPADRNLLSDFNEMISSARYRPASQNGKAVDSHLVLTFSRISVWD
jgi:hypothetical protein